MWCTRWYLPLFILPFSRASPFFLVAFLFSLTLQAKPCLYCVVMLFALAQSSCYWQPVPVNEFYSSLIVPMSHTASLSSSPSPSSTPYSTLSSTPPTTTPDAVSVILSTLPTDGTIRLIDRCWCDLSFGLGGGSGFFSPFDVSRWELRSLERERRLRLREKAKAEAQAQAREAEQSLQDAAAPANTSSVDSTSEADAVTIAATETPVAPVNETVSADSKTKRFSSMLERLGGTLWPLSQNATASSQTSEPTESTSSPQAPEATDSGNSGQTGPVERPLSPWSIDLRPHGMGLVLDFGWGRTR